MMLLILVSLACVSAADENQNADIETQDSEVSTYENLTVNNEDELNDVDDSVNGEDTEENIIGSESGELKTGSGADSQVTVTDVVYTYGQSGTSTVNYVDATGFTARILGHDDASIVYNDNVITIFGLDAGNYTLNVTTIPVDGYNAVSKTANVTVNKADSDVNIVGDIVFDWGVEYNITADVTNATWGINVKIVGNDNAARDEGNTIFISNLKAGTHTLTVETVPDINHNSISKNFTVTVNKVPGAVDLDDFEFDYENSDLHAAHVTGGSIADVVIVGHESEHVVEVRGENLIYVSGLDAGSYILKLTLIPDENHTSVEKTANVTVNKINSTIVMPEYALAQFGGVANIDCTVEGATIDLDNITVYGPRGEVYDLANVELNGTRISISNFEMGYFNVTVVTTPDKNHKSVKGFTRLIVSQAPSEVNVTDVVYTYGSVGTSTVTLVGATNVTAVIVGHSEANVTYAGGVISISGLDAGNYTLNVTTKPDYNHNAVSTTANVTVNKADSDVNIVGDIVFDWGVEYNITADVTNATWGINVKIVGNDNAARDEGNTIFISNLKAGTHTLTVETVPDINHNSISKNFTVTVNKVPGAVDLDDFEFDYENSDLHAAHVTGGSIAYVVIVGHEGEDVVRIDGNLIHVYALDIGNYTLKVSVVPDENHTEVEKSVNVTVTKARSSIDMIPDGKFYYGGVVKVNVTLEGATLHKDNITVYGPSGEEYGGATIDFNGTVITISNLEVDTYNLTAVTTPYEKYYSTVKSIAIVVEPIPSEVNVSDVVFSYGKSGNATVTFVGADGVEASIVGHNEAVVNYKDGIITISGLDAGNYTLNVTTVPIEHYSAVSKMANVTVNKINPEVDATDVVFDYGKSGISTIALVGAEKFTAQVVGEEAIISIDGNAITVSNLSAGNYTLKITTLANTNYNSVDAYANITVNKVNSSVCLDDIAFDYGSSAIAEATLDGATGINAIIEGHSDSVSVDGNRITVSNLDCGNYTLNVATIPDENHISVSKTVKVTVNKLDPKLTIDVGNIRIGDKALVEITINATFSGNVSVQINTDNYTVVVKNGYGNTTVENLVSGIYTATAIFNETTYFKKSLASTSFNVSKKDANIKINVSNVEYGETVMVNVTVSSDEGLVNDGLVTVAVNGNPYKASIVNGNAVVNISELDAGEYDAEVSYSGDIYDAGRVTVKFNVTKLNTAIIAAAKAYVINYGGTYSITVNDANGNFLANKVVTFTLNGKNIGSAKTNSKGVASIKLTASILKVAKAGKKNLVIKFAGDNNYNAVTKTVKITVNKEKTKITAKKKTFKRTKKVKKYSIVLKNSKGKAVKKVKVTLKVKGKTYTAKTNAKGKAVFKIKKLTKKGTYKAKITFKATSLYLKTSKTVKIECK